MTSLNQKRGFPSSECESQCNIVWSYSYNGTPTIEICDVNFIIDIVTYNDTTAFLQVIQMSLSFPRVN